MPLTTNDVARFYQLVVSPEAQYSSDARAIVRSMLLQALSGTQVQVYTFLQQNGEHTAQQIAGMLRMNKDTVKNALAALHEMQLASNDNRTKGAKWKIQ